MNPDRKKPGVAYWATVVLVVVMLYVASFGPACWLADKGFVSGRKIEHAYRPIVAWMLSPSLPLHSLISRYAVWCGGEMTVIGFMERHSRSTGREMP
jgi:hypothetical protein